MLSERVTVMLSVEQDMRLTRLAARNGESVSSVIRRAIASYLDDDFAVRRDALNAMFAMGAPVNDWEIMKAEIEAGRYPEIPGWKP
jgi:predicted DNA-binding protein